MIYPTKEEILENPPEGINEDILILGEWKEKHYNKWKEKTTEYKHNALYELITSLCKLYDNPCCITTEEERNYYLQETRTINISKSKPSIISALHEFAHHILGESELKACSYSVWMYKIAFPKMFTKMKFDGHLLKHEDTTN